MTATDELCRMLDERGVKWSATVGAIGTIWTHWDAFNGQRIHAMDNDDGTVEIFDQWNLTPAQAIAATLGTGTCRKVYLVETSDELIESWFPFGLYLHREAAEDCAEALRREDDGVLCFARVSELKVVDDG